MDMAPSAPRGGWPGEPAMDESRFLRQARRMLQSGYGAGNLAVRPVPSVEEVARWAGHSSANEGQPVEAHPGPRN